MRRMELTPGDHDLRVAQPRSLGPRIGKAALMVMLPALLVLEWTSGNAFSLTLLYLLPVALAAWSFGYRAGFAIAGVAAGYCVFVAFAMRPAGMSIAPVVWQSATTLTMFALFAWAVAYHRAFIDRVTQFSRVDAETGALSAREFLRFLDAEIRRAKRYSHPLGVVIVEANGPRPVLAHNRALPARLAEALRGNVREGDAVARLGPRKFALVLIECPAAEAMNVATRTLQLAESKFDRRIGFCFSVAAYGAQSPTNAQQLLQRAERRLDIARAAGGHGIEQVAFA